MKVGVRNLGPTNTFLLQLETYLETLEGVVIVSPPTNKITEGVLDKLIKCNCITHGLMYI